MKRAGGTDSAELHIEEVKTLERGPRASAQRDKERKRFRNPDSDSAVISTSLRPAVTFDLHLCFEHHPNKEGFPTHARPLTRVRERERDLNGFVSFSFFFNFFFKKKKDCVPTPTCRNTKKRGPMC